jgi:adenylate cyclase
MTRKTQHLAVLFADISDSTRLYATLGDNAAREVVNTCLAVMREIAERHEGLVVKTIGDALMIVFESADLAILTASQIQARFDDEPPRGHRVKIHIGLHYGPVLTEENDYFGYTVNAAAYLTAVAEPEQILTTESIAHVLSAALKGCVRPVFRVVLKGNAEESMIFQVIWQKNVADLTTPGLGTHKLIPGDEGSLILQYKGRTLRLDSSRRTIAMGRSSACDLTVGEKTASRRHASINLVRTHFYLVDHSINGSYVTYESGEEVHVLRGELLLAGSGQLSLGCSAREAGEEAVTFMRDRRAIYRVA